MDCCQNPEACSMEATREKLYREKNLVIGEKRLSDLRDSLQREENCLTISGHGGYRQAERCISLQTIRLLVSEEACPFEYYRNSFGTEKLSLMGHIKVGERKYRPIHIILKKSQGTDLWKVVTVYDPRTEEFRWENNFQERICTCKS